MTRNQQRANKGVTRLAGLGMIATLCGAAVLSPLSAAEVPPADAEQARIQQQEAEAAKLQAAEQAQAQQQSAEAARQEAEKAAIARQEAEAARLRAEEEAKAAQEAEAARLKAQDEANARREAETARQRQVQAEEAQRLKAEEVARQEAEAAKLKAQEEARAQQQAEADKAKQEAVARQEAEAARLKAEQDAKLEHEKLARQEAEAAKLKAAEDARAQQKAEAEKAKQERLAMQEAEAARLKAEQDAKLEQENKARQQAEADKLKAAEEARAKQEIILAKAQSDERAKAEKDAEAARLKEAEAARLKAEQDAEVNRMNQVTVDTRLPFAGEQGQFFYTKLPITMLHLQMDPEDAHLLFYKPPHDKSSFPVKVENANEGRVEVKGSFTRRFVKKSLLITLKNGEWQGYRTISLNSMASDPSMLREWLSWDMARAMGMAVPKSNYVRLFINDKFIGLFLLTEWISPEIYARSGLGNDGELFGASDANFCADLSEKSADPANKCWQKITPKDGDFSDLQAMTKEAKSTPAIRFHQFMDKNFNTDSVIDWIALNGMVGNSDTYNKNYFLYRSAKNKKWTVTPWDYDLTFGRNWDPVLPFPHDTMNDNFVYYYSPDSGFPSEFKVKTLENRVLMERLRKRLRHMLGLGKPSLDPTFGWFTPERMWSRIDTIKEEILKDAQNDPFAAGRDKKFEESVEALKYYILARHEYLKNNIVGDDASWVYLYDPNWVQPPYEAQHLTAGGSLDRAGDNLVLFDRTNGLMVGTFKSVSQSARADIKMDVQMFSKPKHLPPGKSASHCIQRNWTLTQTNPSANLVANVTIDYLHEHTKHNELGSAMKDKKNIDLWMEVGGKWVALPTEVNSVSKTFTVRKLAIPAQKTVNFAACSNAASNDAAAEEEVVEAPERASEGQSVSGAEPAKAAPEPVKQDARAARLQAAEEARMQAQQKKDEEARLKREKAEQARQDAAIAAKLKTEQQVAKQEAEAARLQAAEQAKKDAEAAKLKAKEEARIKAEQDARAKQEAEAAKLQEQEAARAQSEQATKARQEAEAARLKEQEAARQQAEQDARAKQEAEAQRLKADEVARQEAEAAKLKEQEAARMQAEQAAKAQQEAEAARLKEQEAARQKAEQEARAQQEAEARRLKAEEEAKAKAAQEAEAARLQAEEQSRAQKAAAEAKARQEAIARQEAEAARLQAAEEAKAQAQQDAAIAARLKAEEEAAKTELKVDETTPIVP